MNEIVPPGDMVREATESLASENWTMKPKSHAY
jgi:hypothetical protein